MCHFLERDDRGTGSEGEGVSAKGPDEWGSDRDVVTSTQGKKRLIVVVTTWRNHM